MNSRAVTTPRPPFYKGPVAWLWLISRVGIRRTYRYWRLGQKRGWMTPEQADKWFQDTFGVRL